MEKRSQSVCVIVRTPNNDTVIVFKPFEYPHECPDKHLKSFPGGVVEEGESSTQAAARELFEETGIDVRYRLQRLNLVTAVRKGDTHYQLFFLLNAEEEDLDTLKVYGAGHEIVRRQPLSALMSEEMPASHGEALRRLRAKKKP